MNLTIFDGIQFDKVNHKYSLNGKSLIAATELLSRLERQVNWHEKAQGVSIKEGVSTDLIKKRWQDKKEFAANKGKEIHKYIERRLRFNTEQDTKYPEMIAFDDFLSKTKDKLTPFRIEMIIGDYELGIGGTIDTLFYSDKTKKCHIFDWKTNEKFTQNNSWQTLLSPFDDLEDCHLIRYSLQLSLYNLILKRNTDLSLGNAHIVWLGEAYQSIRAFDFTDRLENWIQSELCKEST